MIQSLPFPKERVVNVKVKSIVCTVHKKLVNESRPTLKNPPKILSILNCLIIFTFLNMSDHKPFHLDSHCW